MLTSVDVRFVNGP